MPGLPRRVGRLGMYRLIELGDNGRAKRRQSLPGGRRVKTAISDEDFTALDPVKIVTRLYLIMMITVKAVAIRETL